MVNLKEVGDCCADLFWMMLLADEISITRGGLRGDAMVILISKTNLIEIYSKKEEKRS